MTYSYDSAARLTGATDSAGVIYAQTVPANILAAGELQEFTSPNFANNKFHTDFNSRLQPVETWRARRRGAQRCLTSSTPTERQAATTATSSPLPT